MTEQYLYASGLRRLAGMLNGDEVIYAGMVPMAALSINDRTRLLAYPVLLDRTVRERGQTPAFHLTYVTPDWGSDEVESEGDHKFNLVPWGRTFQHQPDPEGCHENRAAHWILVFESEVAPVREAMPEADIQIIRASALRVDADFRAVLRLALRSPQAVRQAVLEALPGVEILETPLQFVGPVCRVCQSVDGRMTYIDGWDRIQFLCATCGNEQEADIREQEYWAHGYVLDAAVTAGLRPAVSLLGADVSEASLAVTNALLARALSAPYEAPVPLVPPSVQNGGGIEVPLGWLLEEADGWDEAEVALT